MEGEEKERVVRKRKNSLKKGMRMRNSLKKGMRREGGKNSFKKKRMMMRIEELLEEEDEKEGSIVAKSVFASGSPFFEAEFS